MPAEHAPAGHRLSKTRVMVGLQCHRRLWWTVHEPEAAELVAPPALQALFDEGRLVGEHARRRVPGGVLVDAPYWAYTERIEATRAALAAGAPAVYEAAFSADGVFVAVDILERAGAAHRLIEVKSSTRVREVYLQDVAIQAHVLRRSGVPLAGLEVMHLNRDCVHPDLSNLFTRVDVTGAVEPLLPGIERAAAAQLGMLAGALPAVPIGPHCHAPYECPFLARCWPERPPHHVSTLYGLRARALELDAQGFETIHDLPEEVELPAIAARQRRAVLAGRMVVEPGLGAALAALAPPLAFLDFETVSRAIPVWPGCHPYDAVPVQWSCHALAPDGALRSAQWLAEGAGDPRPALAGRLLAACAGAATVVAYNASFERLCLERLAAAVPERAGALLALAARLVDLLPIVRNHVYHPDFGGSFSLKQVLPALVAGLGYDDLAVRDGGTATLLLVRLLFAEDEMTADERQQLRADLLAYGTRDTLGLVRIVERLRDLSPLSTGERAG